MGHPLFLLQSRERQFLIPFVPYSKIVPIVPYSKMDDDVPFKITATYVATVQCKGSKDTLLIKRFCRRC